MMRWYTVPCGEQFCFQHLHAIKGMGSGVAGRVWQEQTDHKLVRHPARYSTKYLYARWDRCDGETNNGLLPLL